MQGALLLIVLYRVDDALAELVGIEQVVLLGAKSPVAFFAYPANQDPSSAGRLRCG